MPVREDAQSGSEQAIRSASKRNGLRQTILSQAAEQKTLGNQTILGQAQQNMYTPGA